jgi:hypothetical protein
MKFSGSASLRNPPGSVLPFSPRSPREKSQIVPDALIPGEQRETLARHARDLNLPLVMISGRNDQIV